MLMIKEFHSVIWSFICYKFQCPARNTPSTQRLTGNKQKYKLYKNRPLINYVEGEWEKGNLQIEQSDKSWNSVSIQQLKEDIYMHEPTSVNITYNDTKELL